MLSADEIAGRLADVNGRIARAAERSSRDPKAICLVLASKTQPADAIRAAYDAGARYFGENYVQEAAGKRGSLASLEGIHWHLIGHLQSNKARQACDLFELIHSLNSERLAIALNKVRSTPPVRVLIELNLGSEATKTGIAPDDAERLIDAARAHVEIAGLMTIPPPAPTPEKSRPFFARLRQMRDTLAAHSGLKLSELSMGMTDDFEVAIEEGATIVRLGRAVFGERQT
ncbi:MAG: YggS family pyridoxal phosphate-dependent enzyme [Candidatus Binataceae bacterium]